MFSAETAAYRYLDALPAGSTMTVHTNKPARARTNEVAKLKKETGKMGDWEVVSRPATADASLLPETWPAHPGIISTRTLADTFTANTDLWARVKEKPVK
ncbi:hypothetical protein NS330_10030 [Curtobacterium citreum]|nr:hypothetical protein NS330_10030 [Curtobacterium citreum]